MAAEQKQMAALTNTSEEVEELTPRIKVIRVLNLKWE